MSHQNCMAGSLTERIDLNVGYSCNIKCRFCYYINDVKARNKDKDLSTEECRRLIKYLYRKGMKVLEFTGGEPTIRGDLFELARFASDAGFLKISIITNGVRLASRDYTKGLVGAGVSDFLLSIHGSTAQSHDFVTGVNGSFDLLVDAIKNLQVLPVKVRCNSVITGENAADLYARGRLLKDLGVKTVNFIMFNPIEQAVSCKDENFLRYSDAAEALKKLIDDFGASFDKITVRYMPFCLMPGYEKYLQNVHQVHYDHDEWDYYLRSYIREPYWKWLAGLFAGFIFLPGKRQWLKWGGDHTKHAAILQAHTWLHKRQFPACRRCKYGFICGGVWKEYAKRFGSVELKSAEGSFILEPWHFMSQAQRGL